MSLILVWILSCRGNRETLFQMIKKNLEKLILKYYVNIEPNITKIFYITNSYQVFGKILENHQT